MFHLKLPSPAMAVAVLALTLAGTGAAVAAIPSAGGTIDACYRSSDGQLRVVDGQPCTNKEQRLTWRDGVTGPVANADQLDGIDSTEFLRKDGKAADSDTLDGIDSGGLLQQCPGGYSRSATSRDLCF